MSKYIVLLLLTISTSMLFAQNQTTASGTYENLAERLLATEGSLTIGGYAQIDYNQPFAADRSFNGIIDVHRLIMLFGYNFNARTQFITEIEFEHVNEVYIEQAFLQYRILPWLNFRGGLMLIPMGIINEYHEPPTYHGVERPMLDNVIAPTTWRELGAGFTGHFYQADLRYQLYVVNGFNGYDSKGVITGSGLRKARQKGINSYISAPNLSAKVEYYGIRGLNVGLSGYFGDTQSRLYHNLDLTQDPMVARADSSVVGISMLGADARYDRKGLHVRGQLYYTALSNTEAYNSFTSANGKRNDVGRAMAGYYVETAYNLLHSSPVQDELTPFVRYERFNTHHRSPINALPNPKYQHSVWIAGLGWKMAPGAVLKVDVQFDKNASATSYNKTFNAGVGVMF